MTLNLERNKVSTINQSVIYSFLKKPHLLIRNYTLFIALIKLFKLIGFYEFINLRYIF